MNFVRQPHFADRVLARVIRVRRQEHRPSAARAGRWVHERAASERMSTSAAPPSMRDEEDSELVGLASMTWRRRGCRGYRAARGDTTRVSAGYAAIVGKSPSDAVDDLAKV